MKLRHSHAVLALAFLACGTSAETPLARAPAAAQTPPPAQTPPAAQPVDVDALISQGRTKLEAGDAAGAQVLFEQAAQAAGNTLKTRVWVLRCWIAQGRVNDTYDEIDQLAKSGDTPETDYLFGTAFATDARTTIESNATGPMTAEKLADGLRFLEKALAADAARFRDATVLACWCAWQLQEFDRGRAAAEKAVKHWPQNPESWYQLGRFALAQHERDKGDAAKNAAAAASLNVASASFDRAVQLLARAKDANSRALLARVSVNLGHTHLLSKDVDRALASYAKAMANDPTAVNYAQLHGAIAADKFGACIEAGEKQFVETWGPDNLADAGLLWWLGWSRMELQKFADAEHAFAASVKKVPQYVNSWFYVGRCRHAQKDVAGAADAVVKHAEANLEDLAATVAQDPATNLRLLDDLIGFCATQKPPRLLHAAQLSEAQARAKPDELRYWNNAGLFYRDGGEQIAGRGKDEAKKARALELWEKAYECYSRALALAPEDPAVLNDTAVMLHYYLDRETDRAKEMYQHANARAKTLLERTDLTPADRELYQTALRDSGANLAKLEKGIKTNG